MLKSFPSSKASAHYTTFARRDHRATDFGYEINRCVRFMSTLLIHIRSRWSDRGKVVMCGGLYKYRSIHKAFAYDHTTLNIPVLVRIPNSSSVGPMVSTWMGDLLGMPGIVGFSFIFFFNSKHNESDFVFDFLISLYCISYLLSF